MSTTIAPIFSPAFVENPYPTYRHHLNGPSVQLLDPSRGYWGVFRHTHCLTMLRDPPAHTTLRRALNRGFTPAVMSGLRPRIEAIVARLLDGPGAQWSPLVGFRGLRELRVRLS